MKTYVLRDPKPVEPQKAPRAPRTPPPAPAAAALGRELSGFVWALGRLVRPHAPKEAAGKPVSA